MSIFSGPREISLKHWRYRLLHWCFNEKDITRPEESALPQYLYCHYCPLFHLTNFIALTSWLVLTIKVIVWCCKGIASAISKVDWSFLHVNVLEFFKLFNFLKFFKRERVERETSEEELRKRQWKSFAVYVRENPDVTFENFWALFPVSFNLLDKDVAEIRFEKIVTKLRSDKERARIRKEKMQARIAFLINFGRHLVKGILFVAYAAIGVLVVCLVVAIHEPVLAWFGNAFVWIGDAFAWLLALEFPDILPLLIIGGKIVLATMFITSVVVLTHRFKVVQKCGMVIQKTAHVCLLMPLLFLIRMIGLPFMLIWKSLMIVKRFIGEFYEDHCPPITIVDANGEAFEEAVA